MSQALAEWFITNIATAVSEGDELDFYVTRANMLSGIPEDVRTRCGDYGGYSVEAYFQQVAPDLKIVSVYSADMMSSGHRFLRLMAAHPGFPGVDTCDPTFGQIVDVSTVPPEHQSHCMGNVWCGPLKVLKELALDERTRFLYEDTDKDGQPIDHRGKLFETYWGSTQISIDKTMLITTDF
jgi:hypothetical protein